MRASLIAVLILTGIAAPSTSAEEITKSPLLTLPPDTLSGGVTVYLSARVTASATSQSNPPPVVIGQAPQVFQCALSDVVILQSGRQPNPRNGSRACSVALEDGEWTLRARNVRMGFKEGVNTRVECQAICIETAP